MCEILGLTEEETHVDEGQMNEQGVDNEQCVDNMQGVDTDGAAIPTCDAIPSEMVISYDKNNPLMDIGTIYPTIEELRMVVRQFAINKEFDLGTEKSCTMRGLIAGPVVIALGE